MSTHGMLSRRRCQSARLWSIPAVAAALFIGQASFADDLHVPAQYPTIQAALDAAVNGDQILLADGTYTGRPNRNLNFGTKNIVVRSASGNPEACIIDCQNDGRAFFISGGQDASSGVSGITIRDGSTYLVAPEESGGGIYVGFRTPTSCTITNCVFESCRAERGGAIFLDTYGSRPTVSNCTFKHNVARECGGAIIADGGCSPTIVNCVFVGNDANCEVGGGGIATFDALPVIIRNCTFVNNGGERGGVSIVSIGGSSFEVSNSIFLNTVMRNIQADGAITNCLLPRLSSTPNSLGNFTDDPRFVDAAGENYRLQPTSPCIDRGGRMGITAPPFPAGPTGAPLDKDGLARICGVEPDVGAFEFGGCPAIENDNCAGAIVVTQGTYTGSTTGANRDGGTGCFPNTAGDVWYRFVPSCDTTLRVNTCGSSFDTVLSLYIGSCSRLIQVACNDDGELGTPCPWTVASYISREVTAGTTYFIRVSGYQEQTGDFTLAVDSSRGACDAPRIAENGANPFNTVCAPDDNHGSACVGASPAFWFSYTATCNATAVFSTCGSDFDTVLSAYTGSCGSLSEIVCNDDTTEDCGAGALSSYISFPVTEGDSYLIRIAGYYGATGAGQLLATCSAPCPCDWNGDLLVTSQDFFEFLTGFFAGDADYDHSGATTSQDFFDFLDCFFSGC